MGASTSSTENEENMKKQDDMTSVNKNKPPCGIKSSHPNSQQNNGQASQLPSSQKISTGVNAGKPPSKSGPIQASKATNVKDSASLRSSKPPDPGGQNNKTENVRQPSIKPSSSTGSVNNPGLLKSKSHSQENLTTKKQSDNNNIKYAATNHPNRDNGTKTRPNSKSQDSKPTTSFTRPKSGKNTGSMRKASSTQSIDKTGTLLPRDISSCQTTPIKRATSTQNVKNNDGFTNNSSSDRKEVVAYNAELLANFEKEKKNYESRISELVQLAESRKAEIEKNKIELKRIREKGCTVDHKDEMETLKTENKVYQEFLKERGLAVEFTSDTQRFVTKQISRIGATSETSELPCSTSFDSLSMECNRSSINGENIIDAVDKSMFIVETDNDLAIDYEDLSSELTEQNWDKQSNKSSDAMSEIALQNLTERIQEMEETNYSTTEELQATLQELGDLQDSVNSLTDQNEGLAMERELLFQSLHTQTKKLQHCRAQNEQLKSLLIGTTTPNKSEREKMLEDLLKSAQEEREELLCLHKELGNAVYVAENENKDIVLSNTQLKDKIQLCEDKVKSLNSDKQTLEVNLSNLNESLMNEQIELNRFKSLYETEKSKVTELEEYRKAVDKSDIEELLHVARAEKDRIELKLTDTQEILAHCQCEVTKLKDQISRKDEELKVTKNNTKTQVDQYELKLKSLEKEKDVNLKEIASLQDHIDQLDQDCDRYIEDKKAYESKLQDIHSELNVERQMHTMLKTKMNDQRSYHEEKNTEWDQFQKDLQLAVVVANDFRREKELEIEEINREKKALVDQNHKLLGELDLMKNESSRLKASKTLDIHSSKVLTSMSPVDNSLRLSQPTSPVEKELAALRDKRGTESKTQVFSVKNIIKTIEEHVKNTECPTSPTVPQELESTHHTSVVAAEIVKEEIKKSPLTDVGKIIRRNTVASENQPLKSALKKTTPDRLPLQRHSSHASYDITNNASDVPKSAPPITMNEEMSSVPSIASILSRTTGNRRNSLAGDAERRDSTGAKDPLQFLVKQMGGSKRNALLKWCQQKTRAYRGVDITNFSSSWNDGLAFCAILHNYLPDRIPFSELTLDNKKHNFMLAFEAAESVGISSTLDITDMAAIERPDWQAVMAYVTSIYKHFELDHKS